MQGGPWWRCSHRHRRRRRQIPSFLDGGTRVALRLGADGGCRSVATTETRAETTLPAEIIDGQCSGWLGVVGRGGVEPPTFRFSGGRSYRLSYLPRCCHPATDDRIRSPQPTRAVSRCGASAVPTGFEPATSALTGRRELQASPRDHAVCCSVVSRTRLRCSGPNPEVCPSRHAGRSFTQELNSSIQDDGAARIRWSGAGS